MNGDLVTEALEVAPVRDDRVGFRCRERHPELGKCNRPDGHELRGDPWHHTVTEADPPSKPGQYWRWRKA